MARRRADPGAAPVAVARDAACAVPAEAEGGMTDRPYQHIDDAALDDEITALRGCINTTRDLALRRKMQAKLAELIAEENRRFTDGLPF